MQTDSLGLHDSMNLYAYVANDPLNLIDPLGREACPRGDKTCIDDPKTEIPGQAPPGGHPITPAQQTIDTVVVTARKQKSLGNVPIIQNLPYPEEQYARIDGVTVTAVKGKQKRTYTCTDGSKGASNILNAADFQGADAAIHTHPGGWADPAPGADDGGIPQNLHIANYGISRDGARVIEKTPSGFRARLISGRWGTSRQNVQAAVRGYNQNAGQALAAKTCTYK